jgi:LysM repeat protein/pimeloyl-ACP methyl ester carboxylesterase
MRVLAIMLAVLALVVGSGIAQAAKPRTHVVAAGHTLGKIARRYHVTIDAICTANGIQRSRPIQVGQKLIIPDRSDEDGKQAAANRHSKGASATPTKHRRHSGASSHKVASGQTLGGIALRHGVSIAALCTANGIQRSDPIRVGQELIIPGPDDEDGSRAAKARMRRASKGGSSGRSSDSGQQVLEVPGAPPAYYYEPVGPGRMTLRPVIFYLHGGGGNPSYDCRRWASVARRHGWLVCPTGAHHRADGRPKWNNWVSARRVVMATLKALRAKYGRRVQLYGNTLVGFSEGAFVAMNIGAREARTFNRWLIIAGTDRYWGGPGFEAMQRNRNRIRRVYLLTGQKDGTLAGSKRVLGQLRRNRIASKFYELRGYGHQTPLESKGWLFESALRWLERGGKVPTTKVVPKRAKHARR